MNIKKYKAVIIGTGRIGYLLQKDKKREQPASHAFAFYQNKKIILSAGCDLKNERLILFKKNYPDANIYTDYKIMLEKEKPDIIVISVEEKAHVLTVCDAIDNKPKLIVLEKPVAANLKDAGIIQKKALIKKIPVCINHERRFSLDYILVKNLLKNKIIGEIQSVNASLSSGAKVWHDKAHIDGSCALIHDATHLIDIIHFLFDEKLNKPVVDKIAKKNNIVKELFVHFILKNKALLFLEINGNKKFFGFDIEVKGTKGKILIGNGYLKLYESKPSLYYANFYSLVKNKKIKRPEKTLYFANMVKNCVDYLDKKAKLVSPLSEGINALKVIYDIIKSMELKR